MGCRDPAREGERERRRLQPASNAAEVACAPSPPKIPIPLVSLSVVALARRNAAENRRSPPSTTPRWQTLRPPPDSLSNILARCDRVKRVKARQSCTIIEDRIVISWQRHPHSSDILFAIFFFFRRRKRFAFLEHTLLFSLSPPSCSEKYYNSIEKTKQTESDRLERRTFVEGKHVACVRTLRTAVE